MGKNRKVCPGLSERMKDARSRQGLTQEEAANRIGLSRSGLCYIEREGVHMSIATAISICRVYGCTLDWLLLGVSF